MLTHALLHSICPLVQPQLPAEHSWPEGQIVPQVPQFEPSVCRLTQLVPQSVSDASQVALQTPSEQTWPLQLVPHCPQLLPSDCVSTQLPEQSASPVKHWQLPL